MHSQQVMVSNATSNRSRAVVLLSGGMDSCVCAALAARDHQAAAVHVSYGQRTEQRERRSFESICDRLEIRDRLLVRNEALRLMGGSALTRSNICRPQTHTFSPLPSVGQKCWEPKKFTSERLSLTVPAIPIAGRSIIGRSMKS